MISIFTKVSAIDFTKPWCGSHKNGTNSGLGLHVPILSSSEQIFKFSGDTYLHSYLHRALNWELRIKKPLLDFRVVKENTYPSKELKYCCYDIPKNWTCQKKEEKCKKILKALAERVIIGKHVLKTDIYQRFFRHPSYVMRACQKSFNFKIRFDRNKVFCEGHDKLFHMGMEHCKTFFKCVDKALSALSSYSRESVDCIPKAKSRIMEYGIEYEELLNIEMVKKKLSKRDWKFPYHFLLECSWKQPFLTVRHFRITQNGTTTTFLQCERETHQIMKSVRIFPTCREFVTACIDIFRCMETKKTCDSENFGVESERGFPMPIFIEYNKMMELDSCQHWGVELHNGRLDETYCQAKQLFKIKPFNTFCESYEWVCGKVLHCLRSRKQCDYFPSKYHNFSTKEIPRIGLYHLRNTHILGRENPRKFVPALYKCNKIYGYQDHIVVYFVTTVCDPKLGDCSLDMTKVKDEASFDRKNGQIKQLLYSANVYAILNTVEKNLLYYIWACKRDVTSSVTCPKFIYLCEQIVDCVFDGRDVDATFDSPADDMCFSPLPLSTLNPIPSVDAIGRGKRRYGPAITFTLPLGKEYPRIFKHPTINNDGWNRKKGAMLRHRKTNLFFNLFLEDCRSKHQFEGFLLEPYLTDTVEYLICTVPFGIEFLRENPLISKGCASIQRACENMKKCYVHHAEYFGFHTFFNENVFHLAITITVIFLSSIISAIITQCLYPIRLQGVERFFEYSVYVAMGFTSTSLLVFSVKVDNLMVALRTNSSTILLLMRLLWNLGSFLLTVAYHVYIVCFTFRFVQWEIINPGVFIFEG